jgi:alkylhydroperoxidase/carboxymuconolactone decarboxylase family protein YurZ
VQQQLMLGNLRATLALDRGAQPRGYGEPLRALPTFRSSLRATRGGEIWTRPGLERKTRSCITLTALMARGQLEELEMHVGAALRNGLTKDEIEEVLLQGAIYCGVPAANAAFAVAQRVLANYDESPEARQGGPK